MSSLHLLQNTKITEINHVEIAEKVLGEIGNRGLYSFHELLPLLYTLNGKPLTLNNHIQMKPLFARCLPPQITLITGRQVSKSASSGEQSTTLCAAIPNYNILHVAPLFEMIRRFSANYIAPLIENSPIKGFFVDSRSNKSILQRSLRNGSNMFFTFAFNDCTRVRGSTARAIKYDEYQDFNPEFEPIINQTVVAANAGLDMSDAEAVAAANMPLIMRMGTPKTLENGLEQSWQSSSQAEWVIKCEGCGLLNIPSIHEHLDAMMGPRYTNRTITFEEPGLVCANCGRYLYTRSGRWWHRYPEKRSTHAGYHIPQCIMPFHCENHEAWTLLQQGRFQRNVMTEAGYYNEICGESFDSGVKLVSISDIKNVCILPPKHTVDQNAKDCHSGRYVDWGIGVDWGGGGISGISKTACAFVGILPDGTINVFGGWRSQTPNEFHKEAIRIKDLMLKFHARFVSVDFCGAGRNRFDTLVEHGVPIKHIYPMHYITTGSGAVAKTIPFNPTDKIPAHIQLQKARSLLILSMLIKSGRVRFFQYDYVDAADKGLLHDFTALVEDSVEHKSAGSIYRIIHDPTVGPDDFAHAVNYAVAAIYHRRGAWPDTGDFTKRCDLTEEQKLLIDPNLVDKDFNYLFD